MIYSNGGGSVVAQTFTTLKFMISDVFHHLVEQCFNFFSFNIVPVSSKFVVNTLAFDIQSFETIHT